MNYQLQHVQEHLLRVQGKEDVKINQDILTAVTNRLTTSTGNVECTLRSIHDALRELELQQLYNHERFIRRLLTGVYITISADQERNITNRFVQVEIVWRKLYPQHGMSYAFVLHKICNALGYVELAQEFAIAKSQSKRSADEERWQNI